MRERERERERERDRDRDRDRDRERQRQRQRDTETQRERDRDTETETERDRDRETERLNFRSLVKICTVKQYVLGLSDVGKGKENFEFQRSRGMNGETRVPRKTKQTISRTQQLP